MYFTSIDRNNSDMRSNLSLLHNDRNDENMKKEVYSIDFFKKNSYVSPNEIQNEIQSRSQSQNQNQSQHQDNNKNKSQKQNEIESQYRINGNFEIKAFEAFNEWGQWLTIHAIPNVFRNENKFIKLFWVLFFLASTSYCFYSIIGSFVEFLNFNVLFNMNIVDSSPIDFPAVSVCNLNPFDRRYSQSYIDRVLQRNNLSYVSNITLINIDPETVKKLISSSIASDYNLTDAEKKSLGFDISYMLLTCSYNDIPCNASDFVWRYDFKYGNCFTFNGGYEANGNPVPIKQMNEPGSDRSLMIQLFLGDEFSQGIYMYNSGAHLVIHNQSVSPIMHSEGLDAATNYQTNVGITRTFYSKLSSPYSNCVKETTSVNSSSSLFYKAIFNKLKMKSYSQKICLQLCLQAYIKLSCQCLDGSLPNIYDKTIPICSSLSTLDCIQSSTRKYATLGDSNCTDCPLECDSVEYGLSVTNSRYPTSYYTNYLRYKSDIVSKFQNITVTDNHIQKNIVLFNIFYDDIATVYISEIPEMTSDALFGNIGGNLGLFIGMSMLSFIEFLEIIIEIIFIYFSVKRDNVVHIQNNLKF